MSLGDKHGALIERLERASSMVADLCNGRRKWTMSVPVQNDDPDIVIGLALNAAIDALRSAASSIRQIDAEAFNLAKQMMKRSTRPAVFEAHLLAQAVITLSEQACAPSATPRSDGMPLLFNVFNMICQDRDEDWKEQWRELMKEIELVLTRAGYTMPKAGGDYAVAAPIRPTDETAKS